MTASEKTHQDEDRYALPSQQTLAEVLELPLLDASGNQITFKSIVESTTSPRHLIVFIRHFYCGMCENYVRKLAEELSPDTLSSTSPATTLSIIGCGSPACVPDYIQRTTPLYKIYCDPSRSLYSKLGMTASLELGTDKPEYLQQSVASVVASGVWNVLKSGTKGITMQGGHYAQNGGEWLWERSDSGAWELRWCKRMRNTRDHAELKELREVLGMETAA